ncbi:MAG: epimerase [Vicingaceae bacterium]
MKIIIFGSTGMVGKGILLECLDDRRIDKVLVVNRSQVGITNPKLKEFIQQDLFDLSNLREEFNGLGACFFPLGVSVIGMSEEAYTRITHDLTLYIAKMMAELNPGMVFTYVSGVGTDSTENGRSMWARVKGKTENDLMKLPFKGAYMFRPGYIQPLRGIKSKTGWYNALYIIFKPLYPLMKALSPKTVTTTTDVGKAMIYCALNGDEKKVVDVEEINRMAELV